MYIKVFSFVFVGFLISSCSVSMQYPNWYLVGGEDSNYLYGVGSSSNLQDAKFEALNDMASQISLSIESDINISKEHSNDHFSSAVSSNIGVNINDVELDSLEYPQIDEIGNVFFVQARIKKEIVISKLNSNIDIYTTDIRNILNSIKYSNCRTLSPKHRYKLSLFMSKINLYAKQIKALNGKIINQALIDDVNLVLQNQPLAHYASFAQGGKTADYSLIQTAIANEYNKFFHIQKADSDIYYIENRYNISRGINKISISLHTSIKDCSNNIVFDTSIEASQDSRDINIALDRLKAQLYKKINSWIEN